MSFSRGTGHRYGASSPNFGRKIGTVLAFAAGGLIACASGFALLDPELPSARALAVATQSPSGEKAAPVVITATPVAAPAAVKQEPAVEAKKPVPEVKKSVPVVKEPVPEAKEPLAETKITTADPAKACPSNAADDRKADCDTVAARKPDVVQAKSDAQAKTDVQAKSDLAAAVSRPSVPAAIAFERAPLITPPPAKPKDSKTKSTDDARPTKQAALPSAEAPATDGTRPSAEAPSAETAPPAAEVAPAPVKPRKVVRTQSQRRSSYEDRYYRRHQNFFFPFFR